MKKNILYVVFALILLDLLYIKAYFYGFINIDYLLISMSKIMPGNISYYLFLPFYYLFFMPIDWLMFGLFKLDKIYYNLVLIFSLDVLLTTIYLIVIFFIIKNIYKMMTITKTKRSKK
ncbi:MAG: hypothetical protein NUV87_02210 [Candidatus Roizmanbacteria bacterium]|nr:hypothetical protein [Candidatus Roizmanbacteria bacterium]MCR4312823.1 hypothetical protein [Candidatus Roizmanbacteria bacterium]